VSGHAAIGIGLLGAGRIGRLHARLVAHEVPGLRLAAVYDVNGDAAEELTRAHGVGVAASSEELIADKATDAVAICTSAETHVDLLAAAAAAGKPVFLEKPVSFDIDEADRAIATVERARLFVHVGFNRRFDPAHASVHQAVAAGEVGQLHLLRISSRDPEPPPPEYLKASGGLFLDTTSHDFDMARFVTGTDVDDVFARGEVRVDSAVARDGDFDTAVVTMRHADRVLTVIDNSRHAAYGYDQRVEAFGSEGMAASHNPLAHTGTKSTASGTMTPPLPHFFVERYVPSYVAQWTAFEHALRSDQPPLVTLYDGRAALVAGLAAVRSVREGRPVRLDELV
jgi:myo-inositol 2-dehydrogenase/D-chiro-inositol 1-dehydrogenase